MIIKKEVLEVRDFILSENESKLSENESKLSYYEAYDLAIKLVNHKLVYKEQSSNHKKALKSI